MKHSLKNELILNDQTKTVKVLANPSFKLIGLGFKKLQTLEKHTTATKAILIIQYGEVEFLIKGEKHVLSTGDYFEIPENTEHEVKALVDSYLYLVK